MKKRIHIKGLTLGFVIIASACSLLAESGFVSMFNGKTLKGWDGDARFWRVENGAIVGESTEMNPAEKNTFLIWKGGRRS